MSIVTAISKINEEINNNPGNGMFQAVGEYLIDTITDSSAACILQKDKTLDGACQAMRKEAEKKKTGNYAVLSDAEGFAIVNNYFGISKESHKKPSFSSKPQTIDLMDLI